MFPQADAIAIAETAHARGLRVHLDGARIWNAAAASGPAPATLAAPADTRQRLLLEGARRAGGLGRRAARASSIARAHRFRKMLGGGMRQAGMLAAAGAVRARAPPRAARATTTRTRGCSPNGSRALRASPATCAAVETNIVNFDLPGRDAARFAAIAARLGVRVNAIAPERVRAVTHLDVTRADIEAAVDRLTRAVAELAHESGTR